MDAIAAPRRLTLPAATLASVIGGAAVALIVLLLPTALIEAWVGATGLPDAVAATAPPLGLTARIALVLLLGGIAAALMWGLGRIAFGRLPVVLPLPPRRRPAAPRDVAAIPVLRRGDAHPDAPARAPVLAMRDLGTPFLEVTAASSANAVAAEPVEQPLPADLDQPMAAFDPQAVPAPLPPPVRPLFRIEESHDDTAPAAVLAPQIRAGFAVPEEEPEPAPPPVEEASNQALLIRLERGLARREREQDTHRLARGEARDDTIQATLASLRRWATTG